MILERLDLYAFGPFSNLTLDLGGAGLHLIHGPNEAGKSTLLRAVECFLFGFPERVPELAFRCQQADLRVGAAFRPRADAPPIECIRWKRRKDPLTGPDSTPLSPDLLAPYLGRMDVNHFRVLYGLNHATLVAGAKEMLDARGELGQTLFAAAAGIAGLRNRAARFDKEAEELYKKSGRNPVLNAAIYTYNAAVDRRKKALARPDDWEKLETELAGIKGSRDAVLEEWDRLDAERKRLERLERARPAALECETLLAERIALGEGPSLPETIRERYATAKGRHGIAAAKRQDAQRILEETGARLEALGESDPLLEHEAEIEALLKARAVTAQALDDRDRKLAPDLAALERDARRTLDEILPGMSFDDAEKQLRLTARAKQALVRLGRERATVHGRIAAAAEAIRKNRDERDALRAGGASEAPSEAFARIEAAAKRARQRGPLDDMLRAAQTKCDAAAHRLNAELARLRPAAPDAAALERMAAPEPETVEMFQRHLEEADAALRTLHQERDKSLEECRRLHAELDALQRGGAVPAEPELEAARRQRDALWADIASAWREGRRPGAGDTLDADYEAAVARADDLADRLRREAGRVERRAQYEAARDAARTRADDLAARIEAAEAQRQTVEMAWTAAWTGTGLSPESPKAMLAWLRRRDVLLEIVRDLRAAETARDEAAGYRDGHAKELRETLAEAGIVPDAAVAEHYAALVDEAEAAAARLRAEREAWERRNARIEALEAGSPRLERECDEAAKDRERWERDWAAAIAPLGLPPETLPDETDATLERIERFFTAFEEARKLHERIEGIEKQAQEFASAVAAFAERAAPDLAALPATHAVFQIDERFKAERKRETQREPLRERLQSESARAESARNELLELDATLETLRMETGAASLEALPDALDRAIARQRLGERLEEATKRLCADAEEEPLDAFAAEARESVPEIAAARLQEVKTRLAELDAQKLTLSERIGQLETERARMDGGAAAAEAEQDAQTAAAVIEEAARRYVRLRAASYLLGKATSRYAARAQDPMMRRASAYFARLTQNAFAGLETDYDAEGRHILYGARVQPEESVPVEGMSDGTRDQLYLALRLAALEERLEQRPLPVILDDLLINFDDHRAAAALETLAEFARYGQVLLFTHHEHLVTLARQAVSAAPLHVHSLTGRT